MLLIESLVIFRTYDERDDLEPSCTQGLQIDADLCWGMEVVSVMWQKTTGGDK